MGQTRESSLMFSLQSLLEVEQQRIDRDRAEQEQRLVDARRRRELAEQRARQAEEERLAEERRQAAERERLAREEAARLEAIRLAELERVRLEARRRSEHELVTSRHEHEQRLAALKADSSRRRARWGLGLALAALVAGGAAFAVSIKRLEAKNRELSNQQDNLIALGNQSAAQAAELIAKSKQRSEELERRSDELTRRLHEAKPKETKAPAPQPTAPRNSKQGVPESNKQNKPCDADDPMGFCLPQRAR